MFLTVLFFFIEACKNGFSLIGIYGWPVGGFSFGFNLATLLRTYPSRGDPCGRPRKSSQVYEGDHKGRPYQEPIGIDS